MEGIKGEKKEKVDQLDLIVEKEKTIVLKVDRHSRSLRKITRFYLFIYLFTKPRKPKARKSSQSNSYIATSNRETLTDDNRRRITWNK